MNFTYGSYSVFSKIEAGRPFITVGLDRYLMDIEVVFTPHNPQQGALVIDDLRLGVSFGDKKKVGVTRPSANSDSFIALRQLKTDQKQDSLNCTYRHQRWKRWKLPGMARTRFSI